jgi:phage tail sheath gpL-like
MADITLPGITANSPPGVYTFLQFIAGQAGPPTAQYTAVIVANPASDGYLSSGADGYIFGPDTLIPVQSVSDAVNGFGAGSPAALMFAAFKSKNPTTPLYVALVEPAVGTQASLSVVVTAVGSPSQTTGVVQFSVDAKPPAQAVFGASDSATTIAASLASAINSNVNLPVTAMASSGTVTITAKVPGARGNNLLGFAQVAAGVGVTVSTTVPTRFTGGAGSDLVNVENTLNLLAANGQRYYYYVMEAGCDLIDGTNNGIPAVVDASISLLAQPAIGLRQRAIFGSNDTVAHTAAVTAGLNFFRSEVIQCNRLDLSAGELAASWAGAVMQTEAVPLAAQDVNFDNFGGDPASSALWSVSAPLDGSAPSASDVQTAILSGITPLKVAPGRKTVVVKRCTTAFFSLVGNSEVLDLTITDAGKVTVADRFFDDLSNLIALRFPRMLIGPDTVSGAPPAGPGVCTPSKMQNTVLEVIGIYNAQGLIDGAATASGLVVQLNQTNSSSIGILVPLYVSNLLHQVLISGLAQSAVVV